MMTVNDSSFIWNNLIMGFWFIYFQFYWFPSIRRWWVNWAYGGLAAVFTLLNWVAMRLESRGLSLLAVGLVFLVELWWLTYTKRRHYLPAFLTVAILDYLLSAFVNSISVTGTMLLTSFHFTTTSWGMLTVLTFNTVLFAMVAVGLLGTQAPMENFIQSIMTRKTQYLLLAFMVVMMTVFVLFIYLLRWLHGSSSSLFFLMGMTGVVMISLSVSLYLLIQTHLQQEHAHIQSRQQDYYQQYTDELQRQAAVIRKFRHDYQNMLLGLGGYLHDQDYAGFRQYYIDIRSKWQTSNAADLTISDLDNMPQGVVQYGLYHDYLTAQRLGVNLFIDIPKPLTATVAVGRQVGRILTHALPTAIHAVAALEPALVNLKITESVKVSWVELTFPVPTDVRLLRGNRLVGDRFEADFSGILRQLPPAITVQLKTKLHWAHLLVTLPMS